MAIRTGPHADSPFGIGLGRTRKGTIDRNKSQDKLNCRRKLNSIEWWEIAELEAVQDREIIDLDAPEDDLSLY